MDKRCGIHSVCCAIFIGTSFSLAVSTGVAAEGGTLLTGKAAMGDWKSDAPGVRRKITTEDLPPPSSNVFAINPPRVARRPADAQPQVPSGFKIELYASGFRDPRFLLSAPNGDIFVVESRANQIKALRDAKGDGKPNITEIFAEHGLNKPFGIAFYPPGDDPQFLYVANTSAINPNTNVIGNISGFSINSTTGALSVVGGSPFTSVLGTGPAELVLTPNGDLLFAVTAGSSYSVWAFSISATTGQLTASSNSPYSVAGGNLFALIDTKGNYLYIGSQTSKGIAGYTYDPNVGTPNALTNSPFSTGVAPGKMIVVD